MRLKRLGSTEIMLPEVGVGTYNYDGGVAPLRGAIEAGGGFIDTAESYGTETIVGEAIRGQRDRMFLATKVSPAHFHRSDIATAADNSLRRLNTTYIDLYQLHEPNDGIPIEETIGAMEDLVDAGKVRFIGVSNFSIEQLGRAERALQRHPIVSNQVRYSIADRTIEDALLDYCATRHITVIAYSPLARGLQYLFDCDPRGVLVELAEKYRKTPAQIALNWCLCRDPVVVIPKGNSIQHVLENCGSSDWRLEAVDVLRLDTDFRFRRRSRMEEILRKAMPRTIKRTIQMTVQHLPAGIRRRFH
jgi:diketogulonate reductase-like aldo/keto reductase